MPRRAPPDPESTQPNWGNPAPPPKLALDPESPRQDTENNAAVRQLAAISATLRQKELDPERCRPGFMNADGQVRSVVPVPLIVLPRSSSTSVWMRNPRDTMEQACADNLGRSMTNIG
jgi:hypothetical protein